jgi:uncharacterized damage-inducible protein DinB
MTISQMLLPEFDQEMANTRKMLDRVPANLDYKPHEKSMTLGQLASHVAEIPSWISFTLENTLLELTSDFKPFLAKAPAELLEMFDKSVVDARKALEKATDEDMAQVWTMKWDGKEVMSMPRTAVLRGMVMNHLIHHRAQLSVYLRLNNVAVPGMYGPSADEAQTWDAQSA